MSRSVVFSLQIENISLDRTFHFPTHIFTLLSLLIGWWGLKSSQQQKQEKQKPKPDRDVSREDRDRHDRSSSSVTPQGQEASLLCNDTDRTTQISSVPTGEPNYQVHPRSSPRSSEKKHFHRSCVSKTTPFKSHPASRQAKWSHLLEIVIMEWESLVMGQGNFPSVYLNNSIFNIFWN